MDPCIGQLQIFGFNFAPVGWAKCDGQLLPISSNSALFSLIGTIYGGDGRTTMALPDLRGRSMISDGQGIGLTPYNQGTKAGTETVTLTTNHIPAHSHTTTAVISSGVSKNPGTENSPIGNVPAANAQDENYATTTNASSAPDAVSVNTGNTGGGQPHNNRQPYLGVTICIALQGLFPSRN